MPSQSDWRRDRDFKDLGRFVHYMFFVMVRKRVKKEKEFERINIIVFIVLIISAFIIFRLFTVQILAHDQYSELAKDQHELYAELVPERGDILVEDSSSPSGYFTLASNKELYLVYAVPREIDDASDVVFKIKDIVGMSPEEIFGKIGDDKNDPFAPIAHKLDKGQADRIRELNLKGIRLQPESVRFYPNDFLGSHVLGYVGYNVDGNLGGVTGLEKYYEEELAGKRGELFAEKDAGGRWIPIGKKMLSEAIDGSNLVLTIDRTIQFKVEEELKKTVEKHSADSGSVIVMNPKNGEIIAMANFPTYNPNDYNDVDDVSVFNNKAIFDRYEPGSTFKVLQAAFGVDAGLMNQDTEYDDPGVLHVGGYKVENFASKSYGRVTLRKALEKSINVAFAQVAQTLGVDLIDKYLDRFGLRELTGIDLEKESENYIKPFKEWKDIDIATSGFGQGITVTPIQLVTAVGAIANNGKMMKPHVVKEVRSSDGNSKKIEPEFIGQPISSKTALIVSSMMRSSVKEGFAKPADIEGYEIAGKTGTAQVASQDAKGYDPNKKIVSFVGFPVDNPDFVILTKIDNAKGGYVEGGTIAAPLFKEIAMFMFENMGKSPSK